MGDKSILMQYLEKRKENPPVMQGRQSFLSYSIKQKIIFTFTLLVILYICCTVYNAAHILFSGMFSSPYDDPFSTYMLTMKFNPIAFIVCFFLSYLAGKIAASLFREAYDKDNRGYKMTKGLEKASTVFLDNDTKRKIYNLTDVEHAYDGTILGEDMKTDEVILLPYKAKDIDYAPANQHIAIFGTSGMRKTSSVLFSKIYTALAAGHNVVCSDPKGEISEETLAAALACGYKPLFLNLIEFDKSDGIDIIKLVREASDPLTAADLMADVLINASGIPAQGDSFWLKANINCLKVHILTVACAKGFVPSTRENGNGNARTMEALIALINAEDSELQIRKIIENGGANGDKDLLQNAFNIWAGHEKKKNIQAGLGVDLSIFNNKKLARVLSEDEIDFKTFDNEKIILYIICRDKKDPYKGVLSLLFNFMLKETSDIADSKPKKSLDRTLEVIMEEAANVGRIVGMAENVTTLRSRNITLTFAYQNIGQIKDSYGSSNGAKHDFETILGSCATKLFLGGDDKETREYFSELSGEMYTDAMSRTISTSTLNPVKWSPDETLRSQPTLTKVLRPDQLKNMKPYEILIVPQSFGVTIERKFYYKKHPMYGYRLIDRNGNLTKLAEHPHVPKWKKQETRAEVEATGGYFDMDFFDDDLYYTYIKDFYKEDQNNDEEPEGTLNKILYKTAPFLFEVEKTNDTYDYRKTSYGSFLPDEPVQTDQVNYDEHDAEEEPEDTHENLQMENSSHPMQNSDLNHRLKDVDEWEF